MKLSELKLKNIAIWGYGIEGRACAEYLSCQGISFSVLCNDTEMDNSQTCLTQEVTTNVLNNFDVIIKSPGISPYSDLVKSCNAIITSSTALWFANEKKTSVIAVTGTKGKSTSVSLLAHVLKSCGKNINLVGNIGQALISSHSDYDYIILEASSFQIYDGNISADIALINNLYPEHVDWHQGEDNYFKDKLKILNNAKIKILNANDNRLNKQVLETEALYFNIEQGFHIVDNTLMYKKQEVLNLTDIQLMGIHNLENIGAVLTVCNQLDLDLDVCINAIKSFKPLVHRLQNLGKVGRHYAINDSIATTPIATLAAMQTVEASQTTLLVGGFDRGNDWTEFAASLNKNPPNLLLISGQNGPAIYNHLQYIHAQFEYKLFDDLSDAINYAQLKSSKNHTLLLSPGAPSFDQFDSYIKRGEFFQKELQKNAS